MACSPARCPGSPLRHAVRRQGHDRDLRRQGPRSCGPEPVPLAPEGRAAGREGLDGVLQLCKGMASGELSADPDSMASEGQEADVLRRDVDLPVVLDADQRVPGVGPDGLDACAPRRLVEESARYSPGTRWSA